MLNVEGILFKRLRTDHSHCLFYISTSDVPLFCIAIAHNGHMYAYILLLLLPLLNHMPMPLKRCLFQIKWATFHLLSDYLYTGLFVVWFVVLVVAFLILFSFTPFACIVFILIK